MLTTFERMVAFRYLRARREEGFISVIAVFSFIGIMLGVATLIVVLSVMRGVREEMIQSIVGLEGHVMVYGNDGNIPQYPELLPKITSLNGVKSAIPLVQGQVMASAKGQALGAMVSGVRAEELDKKPLLSQKIIAGSIADFGKVEGAIIGKRMAEKMGLHIGDDITLISPEGRATPAGMVPRIKAYPITAIFNIGMFAYDNGLVVLPFHDAQTFFKLSDGIDEATPGKASGIEVMLEDADQAESMAGTIARTLGPSYRVYDWKATNGQIFRAVLVQRNVMFLILTLIILVASFNIIASLIMLVREKGKHIAIMRTMGATKGNILRIFIACGASIGIIGTLGGVLLGLLIACNTQNIQHGLESLTGQKLLADELYFLSSLPAKVDAQEVLFVMGMALLLSLLATIYPARKAASLEPAEALRYE